MKPPKFSEIIFEFHLNYRNFSENVAVLSDNTYLLEKAKFDKKITALESERKNFMKERDSASGKLCELQHSVDFHSSRVAEAQNDLAQFEKRVERDGEGNAVVFCKPKMR